MEYRLHVELKDRSYEILIRQGLLHEAGEEISKLYGQKKIFLLTDENVDKYYGPLLERSLQNNGYTTRRLVLPAGEQTKSFTNLLPIYNAMLEFGLTRQELVITLGGGVIGDLGGFAAATYLRGVPFIQIPTSLLAQVDSSIGGKTAVDLPQGKNLVGSFFQPQAVLIDPAVLDTLTDHYFRDGLAEVFKTACIKDADLFATLSSLPDRKSLMSAIDEIIARCCQIKKTVVEADERDNGERMLLNFGHTLGHAIEKYYQYSRYSHGEAVAIGMHLICRRSEEMGLTVPGAAETLRKTLARHGLPWQLDLVEDEELLSNIRLDKKNIGKGLHIVLLKKIGESFLYTATPEFFQGVSTWQIAQRNMI